jgi:hypothetical protein
MGFESALKRLEDAILEMTIKYVPNPANLENDKTRIIIGGIGIGVACLLPGEHPVLVGLATGYTGLKCYHGIRDWAAK